MSDAAHGYSWEAFETRIAGRPTSGLIPGEVLVRDHRTRMMRRPVTEKAAPTDREATPDELAVYRSISAGYFKDAAQSREQNSTEGEMNERKL